MTDLERETLIEQYRVNMIEAPTPYQARIWLEQMTLLIQSRPPQYVEQMERERGLR